VKTLLLFPSTYTLHNTINSGFGKLGYSCLSYDFRLDLASWQGKVNTQIFRLPFRYREIWENYFFAVINKRYREIFENETPDLVFIYNNEMLLPDTLKYFKSKKVKILFILGDSPYYTPTNRYYMSLLFLADLIISPDSFWAEQLKLLGIKNIVVDFPAFDNDLLNFRQPTLQEREKYLFDILFVGTGYVDAWGYKRALFVNNFSSLNLKVLGNNKWLRWLDFFPELKSKFELIHDRISMEKLVIMSKCAKLYPVDASPAILNGVHLRVFDCIAMGVLPLVEYRKDLDTFFKNTNLPIIKNYDEAVSQAKKYISNHNLRESILKELIAFTKEKYSAEISLQRILSKL